MFLSSSGKTSSGIGLQGLSPAAFVVGGSFGTVEDNRYTGFDDHILPNDEVD
jgi:hypothetical protein